MLCKRRILGSFLFLNVFTHEGQFVASGKNIVQSLAFSVRWSEQRRDVQRIELCAYFCFLTPLRELTAGRRLYRAPRESDGAVRQEKHERATLKSQTEKLRPCLIACKLTTTCNLEFSKGVFKVVHEIFGVRWSFIIKCLWSFESSFKMVLLRVPNAGALPDKVTFSIVQSGLRRIRIPVNGKTTELDFVFSDMVGLLMLNFICKN